MNGTYHKSLLRLQQFRRNRRWDQKKMADILGITQSQYCKIEQGKSVLSAQKLIVLHGNSLDMDYLITGEIKVHSELDDFFQLMPVAERSDTLQILALYMKQGILIESRKDRTVLCRNYNRELEQIQVKLCCQEKMESVWKEIRLFHKLSQSRMAEMLQVNIKKYRLIEKAKLSPDVEILARVYELFGYPPSVLLEEELGFDQLNHVWLGFTPTIRSLLLEQLHGYYKLIQLRYEREETKETEETDLGG